MDHATYRTVEVSLVLTSNHFRGGWVGEIWVMNEKVWSEPFPSTSQALAEQHAEAHLRYSLKRLFNLDGS